MMMSVLPCLNVSVVTNLSQVQTEKTEAITSFGKQQTKIKNLYYVIVITIFIKT